MTHWKRTWKVSMKFYSKRHAKKLREILKSSPNNKFFIEVKTMSAIPGVTFKYLHRER